MRRSLCLPALLFALALLCACTASSAPQQAAPLQTAAPTTAPSSQPEPDTAQTLLDTMTTQEKIGQLFLIRPDALDMSQTQEQINDADAPGVTELTDAMRETLARYPVGGVVIFGKNLQDPQQITAFLADLQAASAVPLFAAVDEEGGAVARLANHAGFDLPRYTSAAAVGASGSAADTRAMYRTIGAYMKQYGFNLDFAPVADVNTNPSNPVIGTRAFSSDPDTAAVLVGGACAGLADAGVAATLKHFPGHGDTSGDTHTGAVYTEKTLDELCACELIPFAQNINAAPLVMAAHIAAPNVTGDDTPASLSYTMLTDILRGELGYTGLIVTDSLAMQAVTDQYSPGEAAVQAILAGADLLLMPNGLAEAWDAVAAAVQNGTITPERLDESVLRILRCKQTYQLLPQ